MDSKIYMEMLKESLKRNKNLQNPHFSIIVAIVIKMVLKLP
jgi:hypothetical protein